MVIGWEFDDMIQFGITASSFPSGTPGALFAVGYDSVKARAWRWLGSFIGAKYTDPFTTLLKDSRFVTTTSTNDAVIIGMQSSPYLIAFPFDMSTGWGPIYPITSPSVPSQVIDISLTSNDSDVAVAALGQFPLVWTWISGSGFGTKYSDPASIGLVSTTYGVSFSPANDVIIGVGDGSAPNDYLSAWEWSGSGFGVLKSGPSSPPSARAYSIAFANDGSAVAIGFTASPYLNVYAWSGGAFGAKFSNPSTLITSTPLSVEFRPDNTAIAFGQEFFPYMGAYAWSGSGFGAKFANPSTLPSNYVSSVSFDSTGAYLATGNTSTYYLTVYPFSTSTAFGGTIRPPLAEQIVAAGVTFTK